MQLWRIQKEPFNLVEIEFKDNELISTYVSITMSEYEAHPDFPHGSPLDNFVGLIGELSVRQAMDEEKLFPEYANRKIRYWEGKDQGKYDFRFPDGKTLEIVTVRPNQYYALIKETAWKKSDYAIAVQIENLECYSHIYYDGQYRWYKIESTARYPTEIKDREQIAEILKTHRKPIGRAKIVGYGALQDIQNQKNGWFFKHKGEQSDTPVGKVVLTPEADAYCINLEKMLPINDLWGLLKKANL